MEAIRLDTFKQYFYSPTGCYMEGLQGVWETSDSQDRGESMYLWILEEKEETYE